MGSYRYNEVSYDLVRRRSGFLGGLPAGLGQAKRDERHLGPSPGAALIEPLTYICRWRYSDRLSSNNFLPDAIARLYETSIYLYNSIVSISPHMIGQISLYPHPIIISSYRSPRTPS